ncbi:hypothetical protein Q8A67_021749 [Cirrhinus molitorella]|uniref:Uncharacterized protein n=1 Tax=Cirrhinus molitorella TaxID=172907 RepID=A0AA88P931_9TELE|nr:hypothetical protein Q8A67_021749 [Cirrhinus molitorella]
MQQASLFTQRDTSDLYELLSYSEFEPSLQTSAESPYQASVGFYYCALILDHLLRSSSLQYSAMQTNKCL